eukprot:1877811-Prymnesium_polylepis.1
MDENGTRKSMADRKSTVARTSMAPAMARQSTVTMPKRQASVKVVWGGPPPDSSQAKYDEALERKEEAQAQLVQAQRELQRERARVAKRDDETRRREHVQELKREQSVIVGSVLNKELENVLPAPPHEMVSVAAQFAAKLLGKDMMGRDQLSWYKIFKAIDTDESGRISYAEFSAMARDKLRLKKSERSEWSLYSVRRREGARRGERQAVRRGGW